MSIVLMKFYLFLGNEISQVEGLEGLQLRELVLDKNRIKTLGKNAFIAQNVLVELHLAGNRIRELNHLDPLVELRKLVLDMNKLQVFCFLCLYSIENFNEIAFSIKLLESHVAQRILGALRKVTVTFCTVFDLPPSFTDWFICVKCFRTHFIQHAAVILFPAFAK